MLYLIGLGLDSEGISKQGLEIAKKCKSIYLENYTVEFPYSINEVSEMIGKKVRLANRGFVESLEIVDEAKHKDVALLVYGSPLTATTHISLVDEARKSGIKCTIIYSASVLDAVAETGLQLYKFGKITSIPKFEADSFMEIILENKSINAHSLILCDIGLEFKDALKKLEEACKKNNFKSIGRIVVCSRLGTKEQRFYCDFIERLQEKNIDAPFCIIIPGKLHFLEEEYLKGI